VLNIEAREVMSAQAYPALEVTVATVRGEFTGTTAIGPYDCDGRYDGRGMIKSVDSVHHLIRDKLVGGKLVQKEIDAFLMTEPNLVRQLSRSLILANAVNATLTMVSRTFSGPLL
jgi:enolase